MDAIVDKLELLNRLAVALAIGLLVGLEREWHARNQPDVKRAAGFRTFALSGLLGGISGAVALATAPLVLGLLFIGFAGAFTLFHWLEAVERKDPGATSTIAGLLTFVLGAYAMMGTTVVAVACGVAMALLLALREQLHRWVDSLQWSEIRAALTLLAMTFLLLPILPNRPIDPWGALNPAAIWLLAIMIASISFGGYIAVRLFGDRLGTVMAGAVGGLASSTATTITLARLGAEKPESARVISAGILAAGIVMSIRVGVVATLLNRSLLIPLAWPIAGLAAGMGVVLLVLVLRRSPSQKAELEMNNPLELATALKLTALIAVIMLAADIVNQAVGASGVLLVAAASGLADVDAVTISMARLSPVHIDINTAVRAIVIAMGVNTVAKAVMAASIGGRRIGIYVGAASGLGLLLAAVAIVASE